MRVCDMTSCFKPLPQSLPHHEGLYPRAVSSSRSSGFCQSILFQQQGKRLSRWRQRYISLESQITKGTVVWPRAKSNINNDLCMECFFESYHSARLGYYISKYWYLEERKHLQNQAWHSGLTGQVGRMSPRQTAGFCFWPLSSNCWSLALNWLMVLIKCYYLFWLLLRPTTHFHTRTFVSLARLCPLLLRYTGTGH